MEIAPVGIPARFLGPLSVSPNVAVLELPSSVFTLLMLMLPVIGSGIYVILTVQGADPEGQADSTGTDSSE
jgi:hypothetical protein